MAKACGTPTVVWTCEMLMDQYSRSMVYGMYECHAFLRRRSLIVVKDIWHVPEPNLMDPGFRCLLGYSVAGTPTE